MAIIRDHTSGSVSIQKAPLSPPERIVAGEKKEAGGGKASSCAVTAADWQQQVQPSHIAVMESHDSNCWHGRGFAKGGH